MGFFGSIVLRVRAGVDGPSASATQSISTFMPEFRTTPLTLRGRRVGIRKELCIGRVESHRYRATVPQYVNLNTSDARISLRQLLGLFSRTVAVRPPWSLAWFAVAAPIDVTPDRKISPSAFTRRAIGRWKLPRMRSNFGSWVKSLRATCSFHRDCVDLNLEAGFDITTPNGPVRRAIRDELTIRAIQHVVHDAVVDHHVNLDEAVERATRTRSRRSRLPKISPCLTGAVLAPLAGFGMRRHLAGTKDPNPAVNGRRLMHAVVAARLKSRSRPAERCRGRPRKQFKCSSGVTPARRRISGRARRPT